VDIEAFTKPQGHGYSELRVDRPNPFFRQGAVVRGHEFHYSRIAGDAAEVDTSCAVVRGAGCFAGRDCLVVQNTMATYTHLHATATPEWAAGMVTAARRFVGTAVS
jgi:cobyrinic acid a,c-diamide synthase